MRAADKDYAPSLSSVYPIRLSGKSMDWFDKRFPLAGERTDSYGNLYKIKLSICKWGPELIYLTHLGPYGINGEVLPDSYTPPTYLIGFWPCARSATICPL